MAVTLVDKTKLLVMPSAKTKKVYLMIIGEKSMIYMAFCFFIKIHLLAIQEPSYESSGQVLLYKWDKTRFKFSETIRPKQKITNLNFGWSLSKMPNGKTIIIGCCNENSQLSPTTFVYVHEDNMGRTTMASALMIVTFIFLIILALGTLSWIVYTQKSERYSYYDA